MTSLREFAERGIAWPYAEPPEPREHPKGWEPGVTYDSTKREGTITGIVDSPDPDWRHLLESWGFDSDRYFIDPSLGVQVRTWEAFMKGADGEPVTRQLWYVKATVKAGRLIDAGDYEDLIAKIQRHRPKKRPELVVGDALIVLLSDWQVGKADGGGSEAFVRRQLSVLDGIVQRVRALRKMGHRLDRLILVGLGDLVEGCAHNYATQTWSVDLNRRQQVNVARRMILKHLTVLSPMFAHVTCIAIPGNHGEHRVDGKLFTDFGDNDDTATFEQIADILDMNPDAYSHVDFVIPRNELTVTLEVCGIVNGFFHGHQCGKGGHPMKKVEDWLKGQALYRRPIADASFLYSGHNHHFIAAQIGDRFWFQCPTGDGGSEWLQETHGPHSPAGTLIVPFGGHGAHDFSVVQAA